MVKLSVIMVIAVLVSWSLWSPSFVPAYGEVKSVFASTVWPDKQADVQPRLESAPAYFNFSVARSLDAGKRSRVNERLQPDGCSDTVVLIHGFGSSPEVWRGLSERLVSHLGTPRVYVYDYDDSQSLAENAASLARLLETHWPENREGPAGQNCGYVLIGHSMGGLIARIAVEIEHADRVDAVVTLGTPHRGLNFGDVIPWSEVCGGQIDSWDRWENCSHRIPVAWQMAATSPLYTFLNAPDRDHEVSSRYFTLAGSFERWGLDSDGIVSVKNALWPGLDSQTQQPVERGVIRGTLHTGMTDSEKVIRWVDRQLVRSAP